MHRRKLKTMKDWEREANGNDYVGMRRHERPERYQDSFKYCRKQIEEYLKKIPKEKVLPTGQLTLFDLFDMSGG